MKMPNYSNMMNVGRLRHIQSYAESGPSRNPDVLVRHLLSRSQRLGCLLQSRVRLSRLRSNPFYHYVSARTRHYDALFTGAIEQGFTNIVNIGCGSDTRSYRFLPLLRERGVSVAECDQPEAILAKQRIAARLWPTTHVAYLPVDLNRREWTELADWLGARAGEGPFFILMEGVSPYLDAECFRLFLAFLSDAVPAGSRLAYDYKRPGKDDAMGRTSGVTEPFRLPASEVEAARFHEGLGFGVARLETSESLAARLLPGLSALSRFEEDVLLEAVVLGKDHHS